MAIKNIGLLLFVLLTLSGCAFFRGAQLDYETCWKDEQGCRQMMLGKSQMYGEIGRTVGSASGLPWAANVAGALLGGGALLAFGVIGGRELRRRETSNVAKS